MSSNTGKLIGRYTGTSASGTTTFEVESDRLGTIDAGNQYPWGEEKQTTEQNKEKFATYYRDGTGLYYADQRYYSSIVGRFLTPDPSGKSAADPANPQSWNLYAYASNDPANNIDPTGLDDGWPLDCVISRLPYSPLTCQALATPGQLLMMIPQVPLDRKAKTFANSLLNQRMQNFKDSNCYDVLKTGGIDADKLINGVSNGNKIRFFDARAEGQFANTPMSSLGIRGVQGTILDNAPASASTFGNVVLLGDDFFGVGLNLFARINSLISGVINRMYSCTKQFMHWALEEMFLS